MYDPNMQTDVQYIRDNQKINLLLPDEESLDQIGYKVLQNTSGASLLCGYKSGYNGRVKITYEISKYTSLDGLLAQLSFEQLCAILCDLLAVVEQVYDIGFLQYENVSLKPEDIFIGCNRLKVLLLYFPVKARGKLESRAEFENRLRQEVHKLLHGSQWITQARVHMLDDAFQSGASLRELRHQIQEGFFCKSSQQEQNNPPPPPAPAPPAGEQKNPGFFQKLFGKKAGRDSRGAGFTLVGVGTPEPISIRILGAELVLGKNPQLGAGAIMFNRTISRRHCAIRVQGNACFLTDLGSANGTFINNNRLTPQVAYPVHVGDRIRLANSEFMLVCE